MRRSDPTMRKPMVGVGFLLAVFCLWLDPPFVDTFRIVQPNALMLQSSIRGTCKLERESLISALKWTPRKACATGIISMQYQGNRGRQPMPNDSRRRSYRPEYKSEKRQSGGLSMDYERGADGRAVRRPGQSGQRAPGVKEGSVPFSK